MTLEEAAKAHAKSVVESNPGCANAEGLIHTAVIYGANHIADDVTEDLDFGMAVKALEQGKTVRRKGWNGSGLMVFKQVPAHITSDIIPKMQSLPEDAKKKILDNTGFIDYTSQCLIYDKNDGRADSWVPSISDVFAKDWQII